MTPPLHGNTPPHSKNRHNTTSVQDHSIPYFCVIVARIRSHDPMEQPPKHFNGSFTRYNCLKPISLPQRAFSKSGNSLSRHSFSKPTNPRCKMVTKLIMEPNPTIKNIAAQRKISLGIFVIFHSFILLLYSDVYFCNSTRNC